ncbi:hypothetical protein ACIQRW_34920 [Streptomyces sp. NPDC091287]|uniref:hypothetical protein n=1 Tax=Streptomyces sp. NPDC091287 TaxID=3365988 RepID=UPI003816B9B4
MTATAAARAAVDPRPARGTAGRRAVQVVLFLGGLLALGLLAGGHAEARERPGPGPLTASVADAVPEGAAPEAAVPTAVEPAAQPVVRTVIEPVERAARQQAAQQRTVQKAPAESVGESAAEPAAEPATPADALASTDAFASTVSPGSTVSAAASTASAPARVRDAVVGGAGDTVDRIAGAVRPLVPSLPGLPPLFSVLPVPGGGPDAPGAPSPSVPDTGHGAGSGTAAHVDAGADASAEPRAGHDRSTADQGSAPAVPDVSGASDAGHTPDSEPTPAPGRAPLGPCGDLVRTAVADGQGPRGGDLHAVRAPSGPYTALVRGAGLPATAAPIPDRSGEILEFPG